jgi:uracil-DNA glycosylase
LKGKNVHPSDCIACPDFPCQDVDHRGCLIPNIELDPGKIKIMVISEAAPQDPGDYYYAEGLPHFQQTTLTAFRDAGAAVDSFTEILELGIYFTTAVKCAKTGYGIKASTIKTCSELLEKEIALFPKVRAFLLMGDVAIKGLNYIAKRQGEPRVIPAGSTYKIRGGEYFYKGARAFPSYLQVGPSFGIEKSKRRMIAEDIKAALGLALK